MATASLFRDGSWRTALGSELGWGWAGLSWHGVSNYADHDTFGEGEQTGDISSLCCITIAILVVRVREETKNKLLIASEMLYCSHCFRC